MKDLVKVMWSLYWQRIIEIPFQSLAVAHELSIDARKGSQESKYHSLQLFFFFPWAAVSSERLYFTVIKENDLKAT